MNYACYVFLSAGVSFGDFSLQPVGRAKKLPDRMPEPTGFMKNKPNMAYELSYATNIIGDYYTRHGKNVEKPGHLKYLIAGESVSV